MPERRTTPRRFGITLRQCSGSYPDLQLVQQVAERLERDPYVTDDSGYDCDILAAASHPTDRSRFTYVEQRSISGNRMIVDVTISIHLMAATDAHQTVEIESYNPYFGCNVRYLSWHGNNVVLVYREKHHTYLVS